MPNSYVTFTGNGSNKIFSFAGIDDYLSLSYLKVYINNQLVGSTNYTIDTSGSNENIEFTLAYGAPPSGSTVKIARETPNTSVGFTSNIVDFTDGSILTAAELDKGFKGMLHIVQEAGDTGSGALPKTSDGVSWDAGAKRITNGALALNPLDFVTKSQLDSVALYGTVTLPQAWAFTGNGSQTEFPLSSPAPTATVADLYIVEVGGVLQRPGESPNGDYIISESSLKFTTGAPANGVGIRVRNFGNARTVLDALPLGSVTSAYLATDAVAIVNIQNLAVTSDKLGTSSVIEAKLGTGAVTNTKLATDAVTTNNIQNLQVTGEKIANTTVTETKIGPLAVTTDKIGNSAVTSAKIQSNAVGFAQMNQLAAGSTFTGSLGSNHYLRVNSSGVLSLQPLTTIPANNPVADLDFSSSTGSNGYKIANLKNPTNLRDATNKDYVDGPRLGQTSYVAMESGTIVLNISGKSNVVFTGSTVGSFSCPAGQVYDGLIYGTSGGYAKYNVTNSGSTFTNISGGYGGTSGTTSFLAVIVRTT